MESQCQEGSFPNQFKEQILLLQQDPVKKTRRGFSRGGGWQTKTEKYSQRKARHPANAVTLCLLRKCSFLGTLCGKEADPHVRTCSLSSVTELKCGPRVAARHKRFLSSLHFSRNQNIILWEGSFNEFYLVLCRVAQGRDRLPFHYPMKWEDIQRCRRLKCCKMGLWSHHSGLRILDGSLRCLCVARMGVCSPRLRQRRQLGTSEEEEHYDRINYNFSQL